MATGLITPITHLMPCDRVTVHRVPPLTDVAEYMAWSLGRREGRFGPQVGPGLLVDNNESFSIRNTCEPTGSLLADESWHLVLWHESKPMYWLESFGPGEVFECSLPYVGVLS